MQRFSAADLLKALRDIDLDVCCRAAEQASTERVLEAVQALVELLYSSGPGSKRVITAAARALGDIGDLRAIQHLEEAGFAREYSGAIPGFLMYTADGGVIEPAEEDVLLEEALGEAEGKLWKQPGAEPYLAQLGRIKMYTFGDFWKSRDILIHPDIQNRRQNSFTMEHAKQFFANFKRERFAFDQGEIRSIFVRQAGEASDHSFADGHLYSQTLDEIVRLGDSALDHPIGHINFKLGNASAPYIAVHPEPNWPRPSIVRRCVLDGRTGIRFDEIA
jgi:hypothetical protein